jgi:hypothetical protein
MHSSFPEALQLHGRTKRRGGTALKMEIPALETLLPPLLFSLFSATFRTLHPAGIQTGVRYVPPGLVCHVDAKPCTGLTTLWSLTDLVQHPSVEVRHPKPQPGQSVYRKAELCAFGQ